MCIISLLWPALQLQSILGLALGAIVTEVLTRGPNIDACDASTIYYLNTASRFYVLVVQGVPYHWAHFLFVIFSGSGAHTEEFLTFNQQPWKFAT